MNRFFNNIFMTCLLACLPLAVLLPGTVQAQMVPEGGGMKQQLSDKGYNFRLYGKFRPKVSFRDDDDGNTSTTDIRDDSSRLGIQGKIPINDRLTGVLRGEWRVEIGEDRDQDGRGAGGSLGNARLAYAGLESKDAGFLGIGQQWNPYYDIVGEQVDVLYNASDTPVGYNRVEAPFRTSNLVKYAHSVGAFKFSAGLQANGDDNTDAFTVGLGLDVGRGYIGIAYLQQDMDGADSFQTGIFTGAGSNTIGASAGRLPQERVPAVDPVAPTPANPSGTPSSPARNVDITTTGQTGIATAIPAAGNARAIPVENNIIVGDLRTGDRQTKHIGIGASYSVTDDFYVSALYQDVSIDNDAQSCTIISGTRYCVDKPNDDPSSLDIAAVYSFGHGMKLLAGAYTYDSDNSSDEKGLTLGIAKNLASGLDIYVDWLREDRDDRDATNTVNFGVRYNFDVGLL